MTLRSRKIIYFALTAAAASYALPITGNFSRKYFSVAISAGIALMCGFVLLPLHSAMNNALHRC